MFIRAKSRKSFTSIPGVKEAAVIGVPDARKGEQPVAFVVPAEGQILDEKPILQHVRDKLADL